MRERCWFFITFGFIFFRIHRPEELFLTSEIIIINWITLAPYLNISCRLWWFSIFTFIRNHVLFILRPHHSLNVVFDKIVELSSEIGSMTLKYTYMIREDPKWIIYTTNKPIYNENAELCLEKSISYLIDNWQSVQNIDPTPNPPRNPQTKNIKVSPNISQFPIINIKYNNRNLI